MKNDLLFQVLSTQPTSVSVFDYLKNPLERSSVKALLRMYDLIPLLASTILDEMADRLSNSNLLVQSMKKDYARISRWLQESSRNALERYKEDEEQHACATIVGEYHLQMRILDDLARKVLPYISEDTRKIWEDNPEFYDLMSKGRIKKFVKKYISILTLLEDLQSTNDLITYKKNVIDKCVPIGKLEVGQTFMFPRPEHEMDNDGQEFTYVGLIEEGDNILCLYRKLNDSIYITYREENVLRAVIPIV